MTRWHNWGRCATARPGHLLTPADEAAVVDTVSATARRGGHLRPVGSGHSFTPVAAGNDVMLALDALAGIHHVEADTHIVTFGAGTRLADIPTLLEPHGLAMENLGDIDAQTLAGAISTGTHGTGLGFTGLSGQVVGVRLVTPAGDVIDADADHHSALFSAARLSLGALGILTRIRVRCVPAFLLAADEHPEPVDGLLDQFTDRAEAVDHLEFYFFPHTDTAVVKENTRLPLSSAAAPRSRVRRVVDDEVVQNGLFGVLCEVGATIPAAIPPMNAVAARAMSRTTYTDRSTQVFTTSRRVRFREMEYGIDLEALPAALTELREMIAATHLRISFPVEVRVAAGDDIPLSTAYGRPTAYVAVHRYAAEPFARYFLAVQDIMLRHGGRPHWGKLHTLGAAELRRRYPRFDEFRAARAEVDPTGLLANDYLDRVLGMAL